MRKVHRPFSNPEDEETFSNDFPFNSECDKLIGVSTPVKKKLMRNIRRPFKNPVDEQTFTQDFVLNQEPDKVIVASTSIKKNGKDTFIPPRVLDKSKNTGIQPRDAVLVVDPVVVVDPQVQGGRLSLPTVPLPKEVLQGSKVQQVLDTSKNTDIQQPSNAFSCMQCEFKTSNKDDFVGHMKNAHNLILGFKCEQCSFTTTNGDELKQHVMSQHKPSCMATIANITEKDKANLLKLAFPCIKCKYATSIKEELVSHMADVHKLILHIAIKQPIVKKKQDDDLDIIVLDSEYPCAQCEFKTTDREVLVNHMKDIHKMMMKCNQCLFTAANKDDLKQHMELKHNLPTEKLNPNKEQEKDKGANNTQPEIPCVQCEFKTSNQKELDTHMKEMHKQQDVADQTNPEFPCLICKYKASTKLVLVDHMMKVHKFMLAFKCTQCVYTAPNKETLKQHMESKHTTPKESPAKDGIIMISCEKCVYKTSNKDFLVNHMKNVHNLNLAFKCQRCSFTTGNRDEFKLHEQSPHNEPSPIKISEKDKSDNSTGNRDDFNQHMDSKHNMSSPSKDEIKDKEKDVEKDKTSDSTDAKKEIEKDVKEDKTVDPLDNENLLGYSDDLRAVLGFKCDLCDFTTGDRVEFKQHVESEHKDSATDTPTKASEDILLTLRKEAESITTPEPDN